MLTRLPVLRARSVVAAMAHQNGISHASSNTPRTPAVFSRSASQLAISPQDDDPAIRTKYRPFLHDIRHVTENDWVSKLELTTVESLVAANLEATQGNRLKVLVLYGSLRSRSYSKLLSYEFSRILHRLGCDVRVFDPSGLPMKDDVQTDHPKVQELRNLSQWSDGHVWVSPEQHGNLVSHEMPCMAVTSADNHSQTGVFKTQIDWIPLSTGSVRPTQGRTLAIAQVSGGSQSFNSVNSLRILGRWMRMFTIPNQSSIPMAYKQFTDAVDPADEQAYIAAEGGSRLMPSSNRDRVVDCMEEFVKYTIIMRPHFESFGDRYSERTERKTKEEQAAKKAQEIVEAKSNDQKDGVVNGVNLNGI